MTIEPFMEQLNIILAMWLYGCMSGFGFDLVREIGKIEKWKRKQYMLAEFLVTSVSCLLFSFLLIRYHGGVLRNYIILGLLFGIFGYHIIFRTHLKSIYHGAAIVIVCVTRKINRLIFFPWRFLHQTIFRFIKKKAILIYKACFRHVEENQRIDEII